MTVKVPNWVLEETTEEEILINWSTTLALRKMHEYGRQAEIYERKYGLPFEAFEQRVLSSEQEDFEEWDDYVVWKGCTWPPRSGDSGIRSCARGRCD